MLSLLRSSIPSRVTASKLKTNSSSQSKTKPEISNPSSRSHQTSTLAEYRRKYEKRTLAVKPDPDAAFMVYPRERLGLNYNLNAILNARHRLTPYGDAFRNLYSRHLLMLSKGTLDANKALVCEAAPASETELYYAQPELNMKLTPPGSVPVVSDATFRKIGRIITDHIGLSENIFVLDAAVGSHRLAEHHVRVISNSANASLYLKHMLPRLPECDPSAFTYDLTVYIAPDLDLSKDLASLGLKSPNFAISHPERGILFIGGTHSNQAIKEAITAAVSSRIMADLIPTLPMNNTQVMAANGKSALVVDPSNILGQVQFTAAETKAAPAAKKETKKDTKKETKEAPAQAQPLFTAGLLPNVVGVGGAFWNHYGVFRMFQGITHKNVNVPRQRADIVQKVKQGDAVESHITQPLKDLPNDLPLPSALVFLIRDETSVLPGVAKMTTESAAKFLASGYTGTADGHIPFYQNRPIVTQPGQIDSLFQELVAMNKTDVYLCNVRRKNGTELTAAEINAVIASAMDGSLASAQKTTDKIFNCEVISKVPGVSTSLDSTQGWDKKQYQAQAQNLASKIGL